ncbi:MAG: SAM-dependent methyltransferase [Microthrixaceae bacterium]
MANELLDNIPTRLLARTATTWQEVMVALGDDGRLREELSEVPPVVAEAFDEVAPAAVQDARAPWQPGAAKWVVDAIDLVERGEVLVFDYADTTASMAARPQDQWLRTYRSHQRGSSPLESAGRQDITVEVALDQLPEPDEVCSQAAWLAANGLDELVARAARRWEERAGVGDLAAMRARSVSTEAAALTDESGLCVQGPALGRRARQHLTSSGSTGTGRRAAPRKPPGPAGADAGPRSGSILSQRRTRGVCTQRRTHGVCIQRLLQGATDGR